MSTNYFISHDKSMCSGCAACQQACPAGALTMVTDEEGFLFPDKDLSTCIECGLCERICPFSSPDYSNFEKPAIFATYLRQQNERERSSSGGLFYLIAEHVIENGGTVYGAALDENLQCHHQKAGSIRELRPLRSSKYVQSAIEDVYIQVKQDLKEGRLVYFSGTPCQVAGLKAFLRKKYNNLVTSDLICHGVPNQMLFNDHLQYLENKTGKKVVAYKFRDDENWGGCESAFYADSQTPVKLPGYHSSPFLYGFIKGMTFRYSCYNCKFARLPRQGDITLADFWGVLDVFPDIDVNGGVSMISVNSELGSKIWNSVKEKTVYRESTVDIAARNHNFTKVSPMPPERADVYRIVREKGYPFAARTIFRAPVRLKASFAIKAFIRRLFGFNNIQKIKNLLK